MDSYFCQLPKPTQERKQPCGPVDRLVQESVEVICHSVQGRKDINTVSWAPQREQFKETGQLSLPADKENNELRCPLAKLESHPAVFLCVVCQTSLQPCRGIYV